MTVTERTPLVEMRNINVAFGGVHAVRDVSIDLYAGEVVGVDRGVKVAVAVSDGTMRLLASLPP